MDNNKRDHHPHAWPPFDRPLFENPKTRDLTRVGVIDVGSNSVRLVVFDGAARSPAYFFNEKVMCALGQGLSETGQLNPQGRKRALSAIKRFCAIGKNIGAGDLYAVATAAVRDASDGASFVADVAHETGLTIHVIDGQQEARLSAQGVLLGWPGSYGLVCDIGGASMELAEISGGRVGKCVTSSLGPLKLIGLPPGDARQQVIETTLDDLRAQMGQQNDRLFLVGGAWRAIARIDMHRRKYPLPVLHEYRMTADDIAATATYISQHSAQDLRTKCGISSSRIKLIPIASEILCGLVQRFAPYDIAISSYGIREGMLYEQMPQAMRDRDPLIEACKFAERKDARLPGFGKRLRKFVTPLFDDAPDSTARLIRAACHLHDVSWRAHPDFRGEVCFDYVTRASLGALSHTERVFLGLSLLHRYRNTRDGTRFEDLVQLLPPDDIQRAEVLGKAMRLGAMLWTGPDDKAAKLKFNPAKAVLKLKITPTIAPLFGEVAEARLKSLADALGVTPVVDMV